MGKIRHTYGLYFLRGRCRSCDHHTIARRLWVPFTEETAPCANCGVEIIFFPIGWNEYYKRMTAENHTYVQYQQLLGVA